MDAASGTGKTQQAFAFLAQDYQIVYMLCNSSAMAGRQCIYDAMSNKVSAMQILLSKFKAFSENLEECEMSVESLADSITSVTACAEEYRDTLGAGPRAVVDLAYRCDTKGQNTIRR
jgi:hypothetical protein